MLDSARSEDAWMVATMRSYIKIMRSPLNDAHNVEIYMGHKHGTDCRCQWDTDTGAVLGLCGAHHEYVQKHFIQMTNTFVRMDDDGNMKDYMKIPDHSREITQGDIRRLIDNLENNVSYADDQTEAHKAVLTIVRAMRRELL